MWLIVTALLGALAGPLIGRIGERRGGWRAAAPDSVLGMTGALAARLAFSVRAGESGQLDLRLGVGLIGATVAVLLYRQFKRMSV